ncbi:hypothetical protein PCARR_a2731 [Pseudoalteromonas carrageenovora IAM 12662]|uniref:Uncharacterized protein n=1 Tax=Pseudoalteromonas carrageenovora IAM 12662 TaxID=1314868 RepID=A0ABR9EKE9_PSEVC|nr:hypothetical protein [Pseudoalteromonas carrageenovora IAM 12662]
MNVFIIFLLLIKDELVNASFRPTLFSHKNHRLKPQPTFVVHKL